MGQREFAACLLACLLALDNVIVVARRTLFFSLILFFIIFLFQFDERKISYFLRIEELLGFIALSKYPIILDYSENFVKSK